MKTPRQAVCSQTPRALAASTPASHTMRAQLLHLACAGLLLFLLPHAKADCNNCTAEVDAATQPLNTTDLKCRNLALYKTCLERDAACSDASTQRTAKQAIFNNPVCAGADCSTGNQCDGTNQMCDTKCKCMPTYKVHEGICVEKMVNDSCTAGNDTTCPSTMTCTGSGDTAKCACKAGYKQSNSTCVEKMVNDSCTAGNDTTCPSTMTCTGSDDTAKCACKAGYKQSNSTCVAKVINDTCNANTAVDCGANMDCTDGKCKCRALQGDNGKGVCAANCAPGFKGAVGSCMHKVINDSCTTSTAGDCGENMVCTDSKCQCTGNQGNNGMGVCGSSCAADYKGMVNNCTRKQLGDACTAGQNQTCPAPMYCNAGVCACPGSQKDNGMGVCAVNCTTNYGDNGRGQCAMHCADGFKGNVGNCTETQVNDACSSNSTCGTNQWCRGMAPNATCACVPSHTSGTDRLCVVKKPGDLCTTGDDATCGPNQMCKDGKCGCKDKYKESNENTCVTAGAAGLLLSLSLHFLPLAAVMAITRWL